MLLNTINGLRRRLVEKPHSPVFSTQELKEPGGYYQGKGVLMIISVGEVLVQDITHNSRKTLHGVGLLLYVIGDTMSPPPGGAQTPLENKKNQSSNKLR